MSMASVSEGGTDESEGGDGAVTSPPVKGTRQLLRKKSSFFGKASLGEVSEVRVDTINGLTVNGKCISVFFKRFFRWDYQRYISTLNIPSHATLNP